MLATIKEQKKELKINSNEEQWNLLFMILLLMEHNKYAPFLQKQDLSQDPQLRFASETHCP